MRSTQGGLLKGTYPWLAALLRLLKSRHGKMRSAAPVWSRFGFKNQAELLAAVTQQLAEPNVTNAPPGRRGVGQDEN